MKKLFFLPFFILVFNFSHGTQYAAISDKTVYAHEDSLCITWPSIEPNSYNLTIEKNNVETVFDLSDTLFVIKSYQAFDTITATLTRNTKAPETLKIYTANFANDPNLCLWLGDAYDTTKEGKVFSWKDKSSRHFSFYNADAAELPSLHSAGILNGKYLKFSSSYLESDQFYDIDSIGTLFTLLRHDGVTGSYNFFVSKAYMGDGRYSLALSNGLAWNYIDGSYYKTEIPIKADWQILCYYNNLDGNFITERNWDQSYSKSISGDYSGSNSHNLGIGRPSTEKRYYFGGDIASILIFSRKLNEQERIFVKNYIHQLHFPPIKLISKIDIYNSFCDTLLTVSKGFSSYLWENGTTDRSRTIQKSGTYTVVVTDEFGITSSDSITVTYPSVALRDTFFCASDSVLLSTNLDPALFDFVWSTGETSDIIWVKTPGNYSVEVFDKFGCSKVSNTISVTENTFPLTDFLPDDTTLCQGNSLHPYLYNKRELSFLWNDGGTDSLTVINSAGYVRATVTNTMGCNAIDSVLVSVQGIAPVVNFSFDTVCFGNATSFSDLTSSPDPILSRQWQFGDGSSDSQNPEYLFTSAGQKTVSFEVETDAGCTERIAKRVTVGELPQTSFSVTNGNFGCNTSALALQNTTTTVKDSISTWHWNFDNGHSSSEKTPEYTYAFSGNYLLYLSAETEFKCKASYSTPITIYESAPSCQPTIQKPNNSEIIIDTATNLQWESACDNYSQILEIATDKTFSNTSLDTTFLTQTENIEFTAEYGNYWWLISNVNACKDTVISDTMSFEFFDPTLVSGMRLWLKADEGIELNELGNVAAWKDQSENGNDVISLNASASPAIVDQAIYNKPAVRFDGINDLLVGQNLYADEHNLSIFIVHKFDGVRKNYHQNILCQYGDLGIKYRVWAPANTNYRLTYSSIGNSNVGALPYSEIDFTVSTIVSSDQTEFYSNSALNSSGTVGDFLGMETEFVIGSFASNNTTQLFSGDIAEIIIFNTALTPVERVKIENYLYRKYQPEPVNLGKDINKNYDLCADTLKAPSGYVSYQWSTGSQDSAIQTTEAGSYSVTATDHFGITSIDSITIDRPVLHFADTAICAGEDLIVSPTNIADYTYFWSDGITEQSRQISTPGTYSVTVTDSLGCSQNLNNRTISADNFPVEMSLGQDVQVQCQGQPISLKNGAETAITYLWHDGSTNPYFTVAESETVRLTVTNSNGCTGIDTITVQLQGIPVEPNFSAEGFCFGSSTVLTNLSEPTDSVADIFWTIDNFMASKADVFMTNFDQEGWHTVNLETVSISGCSQHKTAMVFINPKPEANFSSNISCADAEHRFVSTSTPGTDAIITNTQWNFNNETVMGGDTAHYSFNSSGTKTIELTIENSAGCTDTKTETAYVVANYLPAAKPDLLAPLKKAILSEPLVHFEWKPAENAYRYRIIVSANKNFSDTLAQTISYANAADISIASSGLLFWKVIAENICANKTESDISEFTLIELAKQNDLVLWLKADAGVTVDASGYVSQWNDQSPQANHAKQPTGLYMPSIKPNAINNKPAIHFDGVNDYLSLVSTGIQETDMTIFIVSKFAEEKASTINTLLTQKTTTGIRYSLFAPANTGNQLQLNSYPPESVPLKSVPYGSDYYRLSRIVGKPDSSYIYTNSELSGKGITKINDGADQTLLLGGYFSNKPYSLSGDIAEVIVFDTALSKLAIDSIENYLYNKYTAPLELGNDIDYSLCHSQIEAPDTYVNYAWSNGSQEKSIPITHKGTFTLTVSDIFDKNWTDSITVSRAFPHQLNDTTICSEDGFEWDLQLPPSYSVLWASGTIGSKEPINKTGTYSATITDTLGCSQTIEPAIISVDRFSEISTTNAKNTMCKGEYLMLETADQSTIMYQWSTASTESFAVVSESGEYTVTATNARDCKFIDTVTITVSGQAPEISVVLPQLCNGTEAQFNADIAIKNGDPISSNYWVFNTDTIPTHEADYSFTTDTAQILFAAKTEGGCTGSFIASKPVQFNPEPQFEPYFGTTHCASSPIAFEAFDYNEDSLVSLDWSFGATGDSPSTMLPPGENQITVTKTLINGCKASKTETITVLETMSDARVAPIVSPKDGSVLFSDTVRFAWQPDANTQYYSFRLSHEPNFAFGITLDSLTDPDIMLVLTERQTYFWQIWSHGFCGDTARGPLNSFRQTDLSSLHPTIWADASSIQNPTIGQPVTIWGNPDYPLLHQPDEAAAPIYADTYDAIGGYPALQFQGPKYLEGPSDINIEQLQTVAALVLFNAPESYQMIVSKGYGGDGAYTLSTENGTNKIKLYYNGGSKAGTIENNGWVFIISQISNEQIKTYINGERDVDASLNTDLTETNQLPLTIGKDAASDRYYFNGDIAELIAFDSFLDEEQIDVVQSYFEAKYRPVLTMPDTIKADVFAPITITAPSGFTRYNWSNGVESEGFITDTNGTYSVAVTDLWNNQHIAQTTVIFPTPTILSDTTQCIGNEIVWNTNIKGKFNYAWFKNGEQLPYDTSVLAIKSNGYYQLAITDEFGSTFKTDSVKVTFTDLAGSLSLGDSVTVCQNSLFEPTRLPENVTHYTWNTGSEQAFINIQTEGSYSLSVTDATGCKTSDEVYINVAGQAPKINLALDDLCENEKSEFIANVQTIDEITESYWEVDGMRKYTDTLSEYFSVSTEMVLKYTAKLATGCKSTAYDTVAILPVPEVGIDIFPDRIHCVGNTYTLTANSPSISEYNWHIQNGAQTSQLPIFSPSFDYEGTVHLQLDVLFDNHCMLTITDSLAPAFSIPDADTTKLITPQNNSTFFELTIPFQWQATNASYYKLTISTDSLLSNIVLQKDSLQSTLFDYTLADGKYYWQVTAFSHCGRSDKSEIFSFEKSNLEQYHPLVWISADNLDLQDNAKVQTMRYQTYHGFSQTDSLFMPQYHAAIPAIGHQAAIEFTGASFMEGTKDLPLDTMKTIVALIESVPPTNYGMIFSKQYGGEGALTLSTNNADNKYRVYFEGTGYSTAAAYPGWSLVCFSMHNNKLYGYFDGERVLEQTITSDRKGLNDNPITLGREAGIARYFFNGKLAELMVLGDSITEQDYLKIKDYFAYKYQPVIDLPDTIISPTFKPYTLSVPEGFRQYQWSNGSPTRVVTASTTGTYSVTVTDYLGREISASCHLVFPEIPAPTDTVFCNGNATKWDSKLPDHFTIQWTKDSLILPATASVLTITEPGYYQITAFDSAGFSKTSPKVYFSKADLASYLTFDDSTSLCKNQILDIQINNIEGLQYQWNTGTTEKITTVTDQGYYTITISNSIGCSATDSIYVSIKGVAPEISIAPDTVCMFEPVVFIDNLVNNSEHSLINFTWDLNGVTFSTDSAQARFDSAGIYTVKLQADAGNECYGSTFGTIHVKEVYSGNINVFPDTVLCAGSSSTYSFSAEVPESIIGYLWANSLKGEQSTSKTYTTSFKNTGNHTVNLEYEQQNNCIGRANQSVSIADVFNEVSKPTIAQPETNALYFSNSIDILWTDNNSAYTNIRIATDKAFASIKYQLDSLQHDSLHISEIANGVYYLAITAHGYCGEVKNSDTITFEVLNIASYSPLLWLDASTLNLQQGNSVESWSYADKTLQQTNPAERPTYTAKSFGINNQPSIQFSNGTCLQGMADLPVDSLRTIFILAQLPETGSYEMFLSKQYQGEGSFTISKNSGDSKIKLYAQGVNRTTTDQFPGWNLIALQISETQIDLSCNGQFIQSFLLNSKLTGVNDIPLTLGRNGGNSSYFFNGSIAELMIFSTELSDEEMEKTTQYYQSKYSPRLELQDSVIQDYGFQPVVIKPNLGFAKYQWSTGETTESITITETGTYRLTATDMFGVSHIDSIYVQIASVANFTDTAFCFNGKVKLDPEMQGDYFYQWSTGSTAESIFVDTTGSYSLTVTDLNGYSIVLGPINVDIDFFTQEASLGADIAVCQGNRIGLTSRGEGVIDYLWSDGSANPTLKISESDTYSLWAKNTRGCEMRDTIDVTVSGTAPEVDFSWTGLCATDTAAFISSAQSTDGTSIASYSWTIEDSVYQSKNADHQFSKNGTFTVTHHALKEDGCADSTSKTVTIYPSPSINFLPVTGCENQQMSFRPTEIAPNAPIERYTWNINGNLSGDEQPQTVFETVGDFPVSLTAETAAGCSFTLTKPVTIKPVAQAKFIYSPICYAQSAGFYNATETAPTNPIIESQWSVDDISFNTTGNYEYIFSDTGIYTVSLTIKTVNGCSSKYEEHIHIAALPQAFLSADTICSGTELLLSADSIVNAADSLQFNWYIDSVLVSEQDSALFHFDEVGSHSIQLQVQTKKECHSNAETTVEVLQNPEADFFYYSETETLPFEVELIDQSSETNEYWWVINHQDTVWPTHPYFSVADTASVTVTQYVTNNWGCTDFIAKEVPVTHGHPVLEAVDMLSYQDDEYGNAMILVKNSGGVSLGSIWFYLEVNNEQFIREHWSGTLSAGEELHYNYQASIVTNSKPLSKVCVFAAQETPSGELSFTDTLCMSAIDGFQVLPLYPNPAKDFVLVDYSTPVAGTVHFTLQNVHGSNLRSWSKVVDAGYNSEKFLVKPFSSGVYSITITTPSGEEIIRFVKQ